ncbi:hypothetical protein ACS0TY_007924 [Phlomoides rotata]
MSNNDILPTLPQEVICEIVARLTPKPLARFKSVSKYWYQHISDMRFFVEQLNQLKLHNKYLFFDEPEMSSYPLAYEVTPVGVEANKRIISDGDRPYNIMAECNGLIALSTKDDKLYL